MPWRFVFLCCATSTPSCSCRSCVLDSSASPVPCCRGYRCSTSWYGGGWYGGMVVWWGYGGWYEYGGGWYGEMLRGFGGEGGGDADRGDADRTWCIRAMRPTHSSALVGTTRLGATRAEEGFWLDACLRGTSGSRALYCTWFGTPRNSLRLPISTENARQPVRWEYSMSAVHECSAGVQCI
jgi:hypothetical protein